MTSVPFNIPITDDDILEGNENFTLTINPSSLPNSVFVGNPGQATVTIVDDDGELFLYSYPYFNIKFILVNLLLAILHLSLQNYLTQQLIFTDPCIDCPVNSVCQPQSNGSVVCICFDGYNGTNCESYIGFCHSDPCTNGGTCAEITNSFSCSCPYPLTGRFCEADLVDECASNPCENNGTCMDLINDFECKCVKGFTGINCSINIDDCIANPCENNGTCMDLINDFECKCVKGFTGINCSINIDDCIPNPCENNGTCMDLVDDHMCRCVDGFIGRNCSVNEQDCEPNPCLNGGSCVDMINNYSCVCTPRFTGRNCTEIDGKHVSNNLHVCMHSQLL